MDTKYPDGYFPKIEYWTSVLVEAVKNQNLYEIDRAHNQLDHFLQKQFELRWAKEAEEKESETVA